MAGFTPGADSYSALERRFIGPFRGLAAFLLRPLVQLLVYLRVPPNAVSSLQILGGIVIVLLVPSFPRLAFLIFLGTLLLDAVDGALARASGRSSPFGALWDQLCDHTRETLVIAAVAVTGALNVLPAVLYAFVYPAFNFTLYVGNYFKAPVPWAIKSYLVVYPALFLYLWFGYNVLDLAVSLSLLLMVVVMGMGLWRLRRAMGT